MLVFQIEMERLDLMHELLVAVVGFQLFLAPVDAKRIHRALDLGTGTGICMSTAVLVQPITMLFVHSSFEPLGAINFADKFPNIQVSFIAWRRDIDWQTLILWVSLRLLGTTSAPSNHIGNELQASEISRYFLAAAR